MYRACDRCQQEKRKTINGEDIVWAFEALGFDQYSHLMKIYLQRYKELMKMDKTSGASGFDEAVFGAATEAYRQQYSDLPADFIMDDVAEIKFDALLPDRLKATPDAV